MPEQLTLDTERPADRVDTAVVHCVGYVDTHTFELLDNELAGLVDAGVCRIVVDLTQVSYMSSAGIGSLLEHVKKCELAGGGLGLYGLVGMVKDIFTQMQINMLFTIGETADETLAKIAPAT